MNVRKDVHAYKAQVFRESMTYMGGIRNVPSPEASPNRKITDKLMLEVDEINDEVNQFISPRASTLMIER